MDARGTSFIQGSFTDSCLYGQLSLNQVKNSMAERLKQIRERSKLRRQILAQQVYIDHECNDGVEQIATLNRYNI